MTQRLITRRCRLVTCPLACARPRCAAAVAPAPTRHWLQRSTNGAATAARRGARQAMMRYQLLSYPQASLIPATPIAKCTGLSVYYAEIVIFHGNIVVQTSIYVLSARHNNKTKLYWLESLLFVLKTFIHHVVVAL